MHNNYYGINKRLFIALLIKLSLFFTLVIRMFYLQIKEGFYFSQLADRNRTSLVPIIPKRGAIYDYLGNEIAGNGFFWQAVIIKAEIKQKLEVFINNIDALLYLTKQDKERIIKEYKTHPSYYPITIKDDLSDSEAAALEVFTQNLPGVFLRPVYKRTYNYGEIMSHLIGYVSASDDLRKTNGVANWFLGKTGIEVAMDSFLKGDLGFFKYEVNAYGKIVRRLEQLKAKAGNNLALTINVKIQQKVYQLLSNHYSASAVVSDITNGNIIALCSYPSFNPALFINGISNSTWNELITDDKAPLNNKPLLGLYQPGSTIKAIIALKALQMGIINEDTEVDCSGSLKVGRDTFHCWKHSGHGKMNVFNALSQSCDVFFYELAKQINAADLNNVAKDFGLAQKQLSIFYSERQGSLLPTTNITLGDLIVFAIGQGRWTVTPIQLNRMIADIASNGQHYAFNLLKNIEYENKVIYPKSSVKKQNLNYKDNYFNVVKAALLDAVIGPKGTAKFANTNDDTWQLAGKSGTTQVRRITLEERQKNGGRAISNHLLPWNLRDHALFVGFAPYHKPLYAITVVVDHGGSGGAIAGVIAKEIALLLKEEHAGYVAEQTKVNNIIKNIG